MNARTRAFTCEPGLKVVEHTDIDTRAFRFEVPLDAYDIEQAESTGLEQVGDNDPFHAFDVELHEADVPSGYVFVQE
jgi:hypothetical protein